MYCYIKLGQDIKCIFYYGCQFFTMGASFQNTAGAESWRIVGMCWLGGLWSHKPVPGKTLGEKTI